MNRRSIRSIVQGRLPPLGVLALMIVGWYVVSYVVLDADRRFLVPPPHEVLLVFLNPVVMGHILDALLQTSIVAATGLVVAGALGMLWAVAMAQARWVEASLFPYAVVLQCIPILALVPLIGFWFGFDVFARTLVCVMIALFPIVSNTLFGLQSVDASQRELFRLRRASRWVTLWKLELPAGLPAIFAGFRIAAGLAVVGAIVGDFFFRRGTPGLGALMASYQARVQSAELFASILVSSLLGIAVFVLFGLLRTWAVGRWYDSAR